MAKEFSGVPCMVDSHTECHCPWQEENKKFFEAIALEVKGDIQRQGYDTVPPNLIIKLLLHPEGTFYTNLFKTQYPFSRKMQYEIRNFIIRARWSKFLYHMETDPENLRCPILKKYIQDHNYPSATYLQFLKEKHR
jgi:hypothetical protein